MNIGLLGPFGFGNLGDAAIQQAMIQNIRGRLPHADIIGFSLNPADTRARHGIPAHLISQRFNGNTAIFDGLPPKVRAHVFTKLIQRLIINIPREFVGFTKALSLLENFDYLIISGGGQLDDSWHGPWGHPFTLLKWSVAARMRNVSLWVVSVGAGPIDSRLGRLFLKMVLRLAKYRSYRDEESKVLLQNIGFQNDDPVFPDLAFSIQSSSLKKRVGKKQDPLIVGIGPIAYFDPRGWPEKDELVYQAYLRKLASFVAWLIRQGNKVLFFVGEQIHDRKVIVDLRNILEQMQLVKDGNIIDTNIKSVEDLLSSLSLPDLVIASRFHGVLLSLVMLRPVIALSYHEKIDNLMKDFGLAQYCFPIDNFEVEWLQDSFNNLVERRVETRESIESTVQKQRSKLNRQYDSLFDNLVISHKLER